MTPEELDRFAHLVGVYHSTVDHLPHPADDLALWRTRWTRVQELADEIDRRVLADG